MTEQNVQIQTLDKPARHLIVRRGRAAAEYFAFCEEVGCDEFDVTWTEFGRMPGALSEPMGLWLPPSLILDGTSSYVIGIEVPLGAIVSQPSNTDVIDMPPATYVLFHSPPGEAMFDEVRREVKTFDLAGQRLMWDPQSPVFQFAPGDRGYTEGHPVVTALA